MPKGRKRPIDNNPPVEDDDKIDEEAALSNMLFGAEPDVAANNAANDWSGFLQADEEDENDDSNDDSDDDSGSKAGVGPAWVDDDDVDVDLRAASRTSKLRKTTEENTVSNEEYESRLRARQQEVSLKVGGADFTSWADPTGTTKPRANSYDSDDSTESLSNVLSSAAPLLATSKSLPPTTISSVRVQDLNQVDYNKSTVCSVKFHPDGAIALTAGYDKTLRFFALSSSSKEPSSKIHGVYFPDLPIMDAQFMDDGGSVVLCGRRKFIYTYDVVAGVVSKISQIGHRPEKSWEKMAVNATGSMVAFVGIDGFALVCKAVTLEVLGTFKMSGTCRTVAFSAGGDYLLASGSDGNVYKWDIRMLSSAQTRPVYKFKNQDGSIVQSLAVSRRITAVGSESGVVNLYENNKEDRGANFYSRVEERDPMKAIMNLTTSIDNLRFNETGEILAVSSRREKDAMRLVHLPSATVFSNWPTSKTPLGYVWSFDFSPKSGYLAVGNDKGKCLMYRLSHYESDL
ncbi:hypothetical protein TrVE_jg13693 [Triparma verrucosa]|uniref:U3 small nucleolar RNA-associated protein 18 n=1 Tax=Triparma verrucosa TaxID=1606542 RepID=A0A9W7EZC6_9STRA|nr:hypothetical protein TrVE_jg13693 [Triparma verrucosa]